MFLTVYEKVSPFVSSYFSALNKEILENYGTALKIRSNADLFSIELQTAQAEFAVGLDPYLQWFVLRLEAYLLAQSTDLINSFSRGTAGALLRFSAARFPIQVAKIGFVRSLWLRSAILISGAASSSIFTPIITESQKSPVYSIRVLSWLLQP